MPLAPKFVAFMHWRISNHTLRIRLQPQDVENLSDRGSAEISWGETTVDAFTFRIQLVTTGECGLEMLPREWRLTFLEKDWLEMDKNPGSSIALSAGNNALVAGLRVLLEIDLKPKG